MATIHVTAATAAALNERARSRGLTVPELLAELAGAVRLPETGDAEAIQELDRRWERVKAGTSVANEDAVAWLHTWGTDQFRPWSSQ